jgi:trk system potassium uptake protein
VTWLLVRERVSSLLRRGLRSWRRTSPPALFASSFAALIAVGTLGLLVLPGLHAGERLRLLDALFTMTSAVCVTGLVVVDTATHFTRAGQLWLLAFAQLGGIGLLTLTTVILGAMGRRLSLRSEMAGGAWLPPTIDESPPLRPLFFAVLRFTFLVEAAGAAVLFALWLPRFSLGETLWHAVFHAVSAFCNSGLSTFSDSLVDFRDHPPTLILLSSLVVLGGLGFPTVRELRRWWRRRRGRRRHRLSSHTFAVLVTSAALLVLGAVAYAAFEWHGTLAPLSPGARVANAWFMSVSARSSGFHTVPYEAVGNGAAVLTVLLMFVGGSPGSTAGGIRTTTFAVLVALAWARLRGRRFVTVHGRGVPPGTIDRSVSLVLLATVVLTVGLFAVTLTHSEPSPEAARAAFLPLVFDTMSAFATVGLSMGTVPYLGDATLLIFVALMFIGRVGWLSFFAAITLEQTRRRLQVRPAQEDLLVG